MATPQGPGSTVVSQAIQDMITAKKEDKPCTRCNTQDHCLIDCDGRIPKEEWGDVWKSLTNSEKQMADKFVVANKLRWQVTRTEDGYTSNNMLDRRQSFTTWRLPEFRKLKAQAEANSNSSHVFPIRPSFSIKDEVASRDFTPLDVTTNHFTVGLDDPPQPLYQYTVAGIISSEQQDEDRVPSRLRRQELMELAFRNSTILQNERQNFATDNMGLIVSWKSLSPSGSTHSVGDELEQFEVISRQAFKNHSEEKLKLGLIYNGIIPMKNIAEASSGKISSLPVRLDGTTTISPTHAINVLVSEAASRVSRNSFQLGSKKIFDRTNQIALGNIGVTAYRGYFSALKIGMGTPLLNVSRSTTAFYDNIRVDNFMRMYCNKSAVANFDTYDKVKLERALKGVRILITYQGRTKTINSIGNTPTNETFLKKNQDDPNDNGRLVTVAQHLREDNSIPQQISEVESSKCPCINIGSRSKPQYIPAELLTIVANQPFRSKLHGNAAETMITAAREGPRQNRANIPGEGLRMLGISPLSQVLVSAGFQPTNQMIKLRAYQIDSPTINYRPGFENQTYKPRHNQVWHVGKKTYVGGIQNRVPNLFTGSVLVLVPADKKTSRPDGTLITTDYGTIAPDCIMELYKEMVVHGVALTRAQKPADITMPKLQQWFISKAKVVKISISGDCETTFKDIYKQQKPPPALVVYLNPEKGANHSEQFGAFKRVMDVQLGVQSLCLVHEAVERHRDEAKLHQYMGNVSLKANLKLGNVNHRIEHTDAEKEILHKKVKAGFQYDTLVLGADVSHATGASPESSPSIAAVVGNVDHSYGKFLGSVRYQATGVEIIEDMTSMVKDRLRAWSAVHQRLPGKILYYRDGVGDSQYAEIRRKEVSAIRTAFDQVKVEDKKKLRNSPEKVLITTVVVTKRHHTRFYPEQEDPAYDETTQEGREGRNCLPGTCVDSGVTHPVYFDFFLQSHKPMAGTAKPTYYFVLENEMGFTPKVLQDFTNALCYSYVRACLPVGYVPPVYYADRLCDRARLYVKNSSVSIPACPERPKKDDKQNETQRKKRLEQWRQNKEAWERNVTEEWRKVALNNANTVGPWKDTLNDTMFWM